MPEKHTPKVGHSFYKKFTYLFDSTLSKGSLWLVYWLFGFTFILILSMASLFTFFEISEDLETIEGTSRMLFVEFLAPGTLGAEDGSRIYYLLVFIISMFGIVFFSTLVGLITTAFEERLESLRRGRSPVVESAHTVIFGWSEKVVSIIREFIEARADDKKSSIVVVGDEDKVEMEEQINSQIEDFGNIKVICRSGRSGELATSEIASVNTAKSIIICAPESEESDIHVIKNLMALVKNPSRREEPYQIVTEIRDPDNTELANIVGSSEVNVISVTETIARLIVQTAGQAGLPNVYDELLSFSGNELHFKEVQSNMIGRSFKEIVMEYDNTVTIGVARNNYEEFIFNPKADFNVQDGDQLIILAESQRRALTQHVTPDVDKNLIVHPKDTTPKPVDYLILGYNWKLPMILSRMDEMAPKGSTLTIMAETEMDADEFAGYKKAGKNISKFNFLKGDTANRTELLALKLPSFENIIVLSSTAGEETQGDAHTLVTLLHTRSIIQEANSDTNIVTEMLDVQNKNLAQAARADDFIVSDQVISRLMAQYAESPHMNAVYAELLEPHGVEVKLRPASHYVKLGTPVNFATISESVLQRGEIALGYRLSSEINQESKNFGIHLNPSKSEIIDGFSESDSIIVLAE